MLPPAEAPCGAALCHPAAGRAIPWSGVRPYLPPTHAQRGGVPEMGFWHSDCHCKDHRHYKHRDHGDWDHDWDCDCHKRRRFDCGCGCDKKHHDDWDCDHGRRRKKCGCHDFADHDCCDRCRRCRHHCRCHRHDCKKSKSVHPIIVHGQCEAKRFIFT